MTMTEIRRFLTVCLCALSLSSCRNSTPTSSTLTLALNWLPEPEFGGFYDAREKGFYKSHGLEVQIQGGGAGVPVVQMVATGRADFGTVTADELVMARTRGADLVAVFATFQTAPHGIMVHASRGLTRLEDVFKSGTLALETGLPYVAYLRQRFKWGDVKVVTYDGGVARFLADPSFGQQCYVTSEPIAVRQKGGDPQVFLVADSGFNPYTTIVVTRRELLTKRPQVVQAFVAATAEGWRDYLANPAATNSLLGTLNRSMDAATLTAAADAQRPLIETADTKKLGLGAMTRARWKELVDQLRSLKIIDRDVDADTLFVWST
jgi:NitT/TauT family transport system substrate-binding protein